MLELIQLLLVVQDLGMTFLVILVTTLHTEPLPNFLGRDF